MTPLLIERLKKTKQVEMTDIYFRKKAFSQARHFFSKDALQAPKCMHAVWLKRHNSHYQKLLNDPLYDARHFFKVKDRD